MKLTQTIRIVGRDVHLVITEKETGADIGEVVWNGAARYVRHTGTPQGYTQLMVPTNATLDIKPK